MNIDIAKDFAIAPAGRFYTDGPDSGQRFREEFLVPALIAPDDVTVKIDGTAGYGSSFLEEAFGGLVRSGHEKNRLLDRINIVYDDEDFEIYADLIRTFIQDA